MKNTETRLQGVGGRQYGPLRGAGSTTTYNLLPTTYPQRGFTLLIAIVLSSVALSLGLALADVAYKQVVLSSSAKQSQTAFYAADSALECALFYDQQSAAFNYTNPLPQNQISCSNRTVGTVTGVPYSSQSGSVRTTTFTVPCPDGSAGVSAVVTVYKDDPSGSATCAPGKKNCLYANGYNTCNENDPNRFERGLKVFY